MGYSIEYVDEQGSTVIVPLFEAGSVVEYDEELDLAGSIHAEVSVTYNYSQIYRDKLGMTLADMIHGCKGVEVSGLLAIGVDTLGTERSEDYWEATDGNAGYILGLLLHWVSIYPNGEFMVY